MKIIWKIKILLLPLFFILLSNSVYSEFEEMIKLSSNNVDAEFRYNSDITVKVKMDNGLPVYGYVYDNYKVRKIDYTALGEKSGSAAFVHPMVDYKRHLIRAYSFPYNSFNIKLLDVMTGKVVLDKKGEADKKINGGFMFSGADEDSGSIFDYSTLKNGIYVFVVYNEKNEIYFSSVIEKPKHNILD